MFGDAFEGSRCQVITGLSRNRNATGTLWMPELPMAATGGNEQPSLLLETSDDRANLHPLLLASALSFRSPQG